MDICHIVDLVPLAENKVNVSVVKHDGQQVERHRVKSSHLSQRDNRSTGVADSQTVVKCQVLH